MSTDWLGVAEEALGAGLKGAAAGSVVPGLGTAAGGLIGLASSLVPHIFGADAQPVLSAAAAVITGQSTEAGQMQVLSTDPQAIADFKVQALQIAADREAARNQANLDALKAGLADVSDARRQTITLSGQGSLIAWGTPVVSVIVVLAFGGALAAVLMQAVPPGSEKLADIMLGTLGTLATTVVSYWVGSSAGSAHKTEQLANSVPASLMPNPATIVPAGDVK